MPIRRVARVPPPVPKHQATVVGESEPVGQFESFSGIAVRQVLVDRVVTGPVAEQVEYPPSQRAGLERRLDREAWHGFAHDRPGELGRQLDLEVRGYAEARGQLQAKPLAQQTMRHDDALGV